MTPSWDEFQKDPEPYRQWWKKWWENTGKAAYLQAVNKRNELLN